MRNRAQAMGPPPLSVWAVTILAAVGAGWLVEAVGVPRWALLAFAVVGLGGIFYAIHREEQQRQEEAG